MALDLGAIVGRVVLEDAEFQRTYARVVGQMRGLGEAAAQSAAGIARLDGELAGVAATANRATQGLTRTSRAATSSTTAEDRAAAATARHAQAMGDVAAVSARYASESGRVQQAALRQTAAQQRLAASSAEAGSAEQRQAAETARLASAQASAMAATERLAGAQATAVASSRRMTGAFGSTLKMAGELGLVIGGIEIVKKAAEFVMAGKDLTTALNSVQAAASATDKEMAPVRAEVIGLGHDLTVPRATAVDAANAIDDLVRAGMTLPRAAAAARSSLLLMSVSQTDAMMSARTLGDALDEFQLPASQAAHVASLLGGAATATAGGLSSIFDAMKFAGSRARAAKVPMADLLASIVDLSKAGIQGSIAGTGLAMVIAKLASRSAPTVKALKELGIQAWDAQGRFKGLPFVVESISKAAQRFGPNSKDFLGNLQEAFGARAANVMAAFAGKGIEGIDRFEARIKGFDLQSAANNMNRGVAAAFGQIGKQFTALGIDVYQKVEPALSSALMWLGTAIPHALSVLGQALGPLIHAVGSGLAGAWTVLGAVLKPIGAAFAGLGHFLASNAGLVKTLGVAALSLWAAFKGYAILTAVAGSITRFVSGVRMAVIAEKEMETQSYASGIAVRRSFMNIGTSAMTAGRGIKSGIGGAAIGVSIGMMTQHASAGAKAMGALSAGAIGAAQGLATGGPLGAAIGGTIGLVSSLVTSLFGGDQAEERFKQGVTDATAALAANNGVIDTNIRKLVEQNLQQNGTYEAAKRLGISTELVTRAALDQKPAVAELGNELRAYHDALNRVGTSQAGAIKGGQQFQASNNDTAASAAAVGKTLQGTQKDIDNIGRAYTAQSGSFATQIKNSRELNGINKQLANSYGGYGSQLGVAADSASKFGVQSARMKQLEAGSANPLSLVSHRLSDQANSADGTTKSIVKLTAALQANINTELSAKSASLGFRESLLTLKSQTDANGTSLANNTAKGVANRQMLVGLLQSADQAAQGSKNYTGALANNVQELIHFMTQAGFSRSAVKDLIGEMHLMPDEVRTKVVADTSSANTNLTHVMDVLKHLQEGTYSFTVDGIVQTIVRAGNTSHPGVKSAATGQIVRGPGTGTSDTAGVFALSNGEAVIPAKAVAQNMDLVQALIAAGRGMARGGVNVGAVKSWIHEQNPKRYDWGAVGPDAYDCSGLVGDVVQRVTGSNAYARIFSTSNEAAVLPGYGFQPGPGHGEGNLIVGWNSHHTTGRLAGLNFEAYGDNGVALDRQVRVGPSAFDPRKFPNVMHLAVGDSNQEGPPGGDPNMGGGSPRQRRRAKRQARHAAGATRAENILSGIGQGPSGPPFDITSPKQFRRTMEQIRAARQHFKAMHDAGRLSDKAFKDDEARLTHLAAVARREMAKIEKQQERAHHKQERLAHKAIVGLGGLSGVGTSAADVRSGLRGILQQLHQAGIPKSFFDDLGNENARVVRLTRERNIAAAHLAKATAALAAARSKMRTDRRAFAGAVTGTFDITSAGVDDNGKASGGRALAAQRRAIVRARMWLRDLTKLSHLGVFPDTYIRQLAGQGPAALEQVEALLHLPKPALRRFARGQRELANLGRRAGRVAAERLDRGAVEDARKEEKKWRRREEHREAKVKDALRDFRHELIKDLREHGFHLSFSKQELALADGTGRRHNRHRRGGR